MTHDVTFHITGCLLQLPAIIALFVAIKKRSFIWLLVAIAIASAGLALIANLAD